MDNILLGWVWMETRKTMTAACSHNYNIIRSTIAVTKATEHLCLESGVSGGSLLIHYLTTLSLPVYCSKKMNKNIIKNVNATHRNLHKGHNISGFPKSLLWDKWHTRCGYTVLCPHSNSLTVSVESQRGKRNRTSLCFIVICPYNNFHWQRRAWKLWLEWEDGMGVDECDHSVELHIANWLLNLQLRMRLLCFSKVKNCDKLPVLPVVQAKCCVFAATSTTREILQ